MPTAMTESIEQVCGDFDTQTRTHPRAPGPTMIFRSTKKKPKVRKWEMDDDDNAGGYVCTFVFFFVVLKLKKKVQKHRRQLRRS